MKGWGSEELMSSYDTERKQIAFENLKHVQDGIDIVVNPIFGAISHGADILNGEGEQSEKVRAELVEICKREPWLHEQNGNILGYSYKESPVIIETQEKTPRPEQPNGYYNPTTFPGNQAPHVWMKDGKSTLDQFSPTVFSIVDFSLDGSLSKPFVEAAKELGIPLQSLGWHQEDNVRKVYERDLVLVRPDTHVCWRCLDGGAEPLSKEEAGDILRKVAGR